MKTPKEKIAEMLLEELRTSTEKWYYISVAAEEFHGGWLVQGRGPTDAWVRLHGLNGVPKGHETLTNGPIDDEVMERIPESQRYRKLSKEEAESLGK